MIYLLVDVTIEFYSLTEQIRGEKDLKRELIFNLVTNLVLTAELYFLVYNLHTQTQES